MKKTVVTLATLALLSFTLACNNGGQPAANASKTEEQKPEVQTPSGGGSETTNKRSVPANNPPAPENTKLGSAVPPALNDNTRPHPQQPNPNPPSTPQE
jgi:hypothetical protein